MESREAMILAVTVYERNFSNYVEKPVISVVSVNEAEHFLSHLSWLIDRDGYETRLVSSQLVYVFVCRYGPDHAQTTPFFPIVLNTANQ